MAFEHHNQNNVLKLFLVVQMPMFSWVYSMIQTMHCITYMIMFIGALSSTRCLKSKLIYRDPIEMNRY